MNTDTEAAILAGGCFWPAQELFRRRKGVLSTRVGYTGGENENPDGGHHPGHAEAVEVIFDSEQTSFRAILRSSRSTGPTSTTPWSAPITARLLHQRRAATGRRGHPC